MNYRKSEAKEAARAQFRGLWAAITTPFTSDLQVDEAGLRHNMQHLTRALKIEGVFCTGAMGEFWSLTKEERKRIVEIVVEEARRGGCKVIAHTAHHSAHETVELTRHAQEVGADFAILMNPYYPPASEDTICQKVYQSSPVPYLAQTPTWLPMREYTELGLQGRFDEAARVAERLQPLYKITSKWMRLSWANKKLLPIAYVKAWSELMGMAGGPVRPGLPQITEKERKELRVDVDGTGLLSRVPTAKAA